MKDLTKKLSNSPLAKVSIESSIPINLSKEIRDKIAYLCKTINKDEWYGVLIYETFGTITNLKDFSITLLDVFPMHKGNGTSTGSDWDGELAGYLVDNPHLLGKQIGLIHSHNSMNVFFSTTDLQELVDNAGSHNYYLSVIVNNWGDIIGKIASIAYPKQLFLSNENGEKYAINVEAPPYLCIYNCRVLSDEPVIEIKEEYKKRVQFIIDEASKPKISSFNNFGNGGFNYNSQQKYPSYKDQYFDKTQSQQTKLNPKNISNIIDNTDYDDDIEIISFINYLLSNGTISGNVEYDSILSSIDKMNKQNQKIRLSLINNNIIKHYDDFFGEETNLMKQQGLSAIYDELFEVVDSYPFIETILDNITFQIDKLYEQK